MTKLEEDEILEYANREFVRLVNAEIQLLINICEPDFDTYFAEKLITPRWGGALSLDELDEVIKHYNDMLLSLINSDFEIKYHQEILDAIANITILLHCHSETIASYSRY